MKKHIYAIGSFALALAVSGLPAIAAHAEEGYGGISGDVRVNLGSNTQTSGVNASTSVSVRTQKGEGELEIEDDATPAVSSLSELKQSIKIREQELDQEMVGTTSVNQDIAENENPVRVAVHALLASKNLLGGIGPQVSQIAKEMNDSIATTTAAEARIQARGFFIRFLFGGDSSAAAMISEEVAQNQQHIDALTMLLNQANVSADIQVTLKAQIAAIQDAQARLQDLANKEEGQWGLFSWRF